MLLNQDQDLLADLSIAICSSYAYCKRISSRAPADPVGPFVDQWSVTLSYFDPVSVSEICEGPKSGPSQSISRQWDVKYFLNMDLRLVTFETFDQSDNLI